MVVGTTIKSFSEAEIIEEDSIEMNYSSSNKESSQKIEIHQLNDLLSMINNDASLLSYILQKHDIEALSQLTEEQYILTRDELRLLNVPKVQETSQESKAA
jgi:maltodextrin utilization protein YvdJ